MNKEIRISIKKLALIIIVLGIFSGTISYVTADIVINSNQVGYTDNSGLGVDNVQAAIDGTCTNVDTRLTDIQDKITKSAEYIVSMNSSRTISLSDVSNAGSAILFVRLGNTLNAYMITDNTVITNNFSTASTGYVTVSLSNGAITISNTNENVNGIAILVGLNA